MDDRLTLADLASEGVSRDEQLTHELESLQRLNGTLGSVSNALAMAQNNMESLYETVESSDRLLDLWIKTLSQTEHTQRLLLNGRWHGATKDLDDLNAQARHEEETKLQRERMEQAMAEQRAAEQVAAAASTTSSNNSTTAATEKENVDKSASKIEGTKAAMDRKKKPYVSVYAQSRLARGGSSSSASTNRSGLQQQQQQRKGSRT